MLFPAPVVVGHGLSRDDPLPPWVLSQQRLCETAIDGVFYATQTQNTEEMKFAAQLVGFCRRQATSSTGLGWKQTRLWPMTLWWKFCLGHLWQNSHSTLCPRSLLILAAVACQISVASAAHLGPAAPSHVLNMFSVTFKIPVHTLHPSPLASAAPDDRPLTSYESRPPRARFHSFIHPSLLTELRSKEETDCSRFLLSSCLPGAVLLFVQWNVWYSENWKSCRLITNSLPLLDVSRQPNVRGHSVGGYWTENVRRGGIMKEMRRNKKGGNWCTFVCATQIRRHTCHY